jgi:hypothetical protein
VNHARRDLCGGHPVNGCPYRDVRRETAQRVKVKVLNSEGIASHADPESCVVHREVRDEALTGKPAGQPLSRESKIRTGC